MTDRSIAHVIQAALVDAGYVVTTTGYAADNMTLWVDDGCGNAYDVSCRIAHIRRPRAIGAVLRGFVSEGAES